jgi:hypothetical protein
MLERRVQNGIDKMANSNQKRQLGISFLFGKVFDIIKSTGDDTANISL